MIRTMRLNAYTDRNRALEEAAGLRLAFAEHPIARSFTIDVSLYQGEHHVNVSGDVDTSVDGFMSVIVARVLASFCRAPAEPLRLQTNGSGPSRLSSQSPTRAIGSRFSAGVPARVPRAPYRGG